jgi:hypothetical protein
MGLSLPEVSTLVAVVVAIGGSLYALRKQGGVQAASTSVELARRLRAAESTISYLQNEMIVLRAEMVERVGALQEERQEALAKWEEARAATLLLTEEAAQLRRQNKERFEQVEALTKALEAVNDK